jgi:hypothetical protein
MTKLGGHILNLKAFVARKTETLSSFSCNIDIWWVVNFLQNGGPKLCHCIAYYYTVSFGVESFVFQFAIHKFRDQDIQNYNFACCLVWV